MYIMRSSSVKFAVQFVVCKMYNVHNFKRELTTKIKLLFDFISENFRFQICCIATKDFSIKCMKTMWCYCEKLRRHSFVNLRELSIRLTLLEIDSLHFSFALFSGLNRFFIPLHP